MKKILLIVLMVVALFGTVNAGINANVFAGWTWVSMANVNQVINGRYVAISNYYEHTLGIADDSIHCTKSNLGNAAEIGLDITYTLMPGLNVGPRLEYIGGFGLPGAKFTCISPDYASSDTMEFGGSLVPVMLGASYDMSLGGLTVGAEAFGGYGFANCYVYAKAVGSFSALAGSWGRTNYETTRYEASGAPVAAGSLKADYKIGKNMSIGGKVGYRHAKFNKMKFTEQNLYLGALEGKTVRNGSNTADLLYDFSGMTGDINFGISF